MPTKPTAIVYIDAFNLYKGQLVQRPENKWINLEALADRLLPDHNVITVHYFAGRVKGTANPDDPEAPARQDRLIRALATLPRIQMHMSQFSVNPGRARAQNLTGRASPATWLDVWKVQEKGTDVKLAVQLLMDSLDQRADLLAVVTGDSDLAPAMEVATSRFNQKVAVIYPRTKRSKHIEAAGIESARYLHPADVAASQFPDTVVTARGTQIHRPAAWKKLNPTG